MKRLTVVMSEPEKLALEKMARQELRNPGECIRVLIRQAAVDRGLVPMKDIGLGVSSSSSLAGWPNESAQ